MNQTKLYNSLQEGNHNGLVQQNRDLQGALKAKEQIFKQIKDILEANTTPPCLDICRDCNNCNDEIVNDSGENTCMQYGINQVLALLEIKEGK